MITKLMQHWLAGISLMLSCLAFLPGNGQFRDDGIIALFAVPACLVALAGTLLNHRRGISKGPEEVALGISVGALLQTLICT